MFPSRAGLGGLKRHLVAFADLQVRLGTFALAVAMLAALFLVLDVVLPRLVAVVVLVPFGALFGVLWFVLPRRGLRRLPDAFAEQSSGDHGALPGNGDGPGARRRRGR